MPRAGSALAVVTFSQILASFSLSMCAFCVGVSVAYTSPALSSMQDSNRTDFEVSKEAASWIGSSMPLGAVVGGLSGAPLVIFLGRKRTAHVTAVPYIGSWILMALANAVYMLLIGRAINGFAVGMMALALPVYLGETLHPRIRGSLGIMPTMIGNMGMLTVFLLGWVLSWRNLAIAGAILGLPYAILLFFLPESPRWFLSKGKPEKALKSLTWLRRKDADIATEMTEMETLQAENAARKGSIRDMFRKKYFRAFFVANGLMFFQQFSGINAVMFYTVSIFKEAGSTIDSNLCTIIVGLVNCTGALIATLIIDLVGRKILLYVSETVMFVTLAILSIYFRQREKGADTSNIGWLPLVSFVIYMLGFSLGFGPIPFLIMGEVLPARIRGPAASIVISFNWLCTFIVTKTFKNMIDLIGIYGAFGVFCVVCFVGFCFILFVVPETKGKSLEEIEQEITKQKIHVMK